MPTHKTLCHRPPSRPDAHPKTPRGWIPSVVVLLFAAVSVAGCASKGETPKDTAATQQSAPLVDRAEPTRPPASQTAPERTTAASKVSSGSAASSQGVAGSMGETTRPGQTSGPTQRATSTESERRTDFTPTEVTDPEVVPPTDPAPTDSGDQAENEAVPATPQVETAATTAPAIDGGGSTGPDEPLVDGDILILVPADVGGVPAPVLEEADDEPIGGVMRPAPEQEELPDVGTAFEEGEEEAAADTLEGIIGRWEQTAGGNQPDFVEGGYRVAEFEFKPGGRLVIRLLYDEEGTIELIRRTDYRVDTSGNVRLGEDKPFGDSVLIEDRLTITLNKREGEVVILPADVTLPVDLKVAVQGDEMTLGGKRYSRR